MAETVAVEGAHERGFGWMIRNEGICYVIVPRHVVVGSRRITVTSSAPLTTGTGEPILPFFKEFDLGLVRVRGGIEERCASDYRQLDVDAATRRVRQAQLERLVNGAIERTPIRIQDFGYHSFTGVMEDEGARDIMGGTSGAFAFVGDTPIGMAYDSTEARSAIFMRSEEIHMHLDRYLTERGGRLADQETESAYNAPGQAAFALRAVTRPPISPDHAPENMMGEGRYVFAPEGRAAILFELLETAPTLSRVVMSSRPENGLSRPRDVLVEVSPSAESTRFFRLGQFRMAGDGVLDTGQIAPRTAKLLRLTILNVWGEGPVAIDRVEIYGN